MKIAEIIVPLLNANEPEAVIVTVHGKNGSFVKKGDVIYTIETTKATSDVVSPDEGYLQIINNVGEIVRVGEPMAILVDDVKDTIGTRISTNKKNKIKEELNGQSQGVRITNPAKKLAQSLGINIDSLPKEKLITEDVVKNYAEKNEQPEVDLAALKRDPIVIYGGGGHAKTVIDLIMSSDEYSIVGIIDDDVLRTGKKVLGIPILGGSLYLERLHELGIRKAVNCVGGIVDINIRLRITNLLLAKGFILPTLVHSSAIIEPSAKILNGSQILAKSYIGSDASIGEGCMINTSAVISHDCLVGNHSHVAPGSLLAGNVIVGERTLIGMGVTTTVGIKIGSGVRIGNGAILLTDVPDHTIIQAGRYWVGKKE